MADHSEDRLSSRAKDLVWHAHLARHAHMVAELDYLRAVLRLAEEDLPLAQIAKPLHMSAFEVEMSFVQAADVTPVREGFAGASPYELCQRFATGELTRAELVGQLVQWSDGEVRALDEVRDHVELAFTHGLLDDSTHAAIRAAIWPTSSY